MLGITFPYSCDSPNALFQRRDVSAWMLGRQGDGAAMKPPPRALAPRLRPARPDRTAGRLEQRLTQASNPCDAAGITPEETTMATAPDATSFSNFAPIDTEYDLPN